MRDIVCGAAPLCRLTHIVHMPTECMWPESSQTVTLICRCNKWKRFCNIFVLYSTSLPVKVAEALFIYFFTVFLVVGQGQGDVWHSVALKKKIICTHDIRLTIASSSSWSSGKKKHVFKCWTARIIWHASGFSSENDTTIQLATFHSLFLIQESFNEDYCIQPFLEENLMQMKTAGLLWCLHTTLLHCDFFEILFL